MTYIDIVFDGPPDHVAPRFIEVEDASGRSISIGEWLQRTDGLWALRIAESGAERALRAMGFGGNRVDEKVGWLGSYPEPLKDHFRCEFCLAEHLDCTLIEHAPDCAVPLARAALAEGPAAESKLASTARPEGTPPLSKGSTHERK